MNRRLISLITVIAICGGILAGCRRSEETKKKKTVKKTSEAATSESEEEQDDPLASYPPYQGDPADGQEPVNSNSKGSRSDATGEDVLDLDPDRVLFTYEYNNYAWGYQNEVYAVMGDGRMYIFSVSLTPAATGNGMTYEDILLENVKLISKTEAAVSLDEDYLLELYKKASQVDPNAGKTGEQVMYDYGQKELFFWNEKGEKVLCSSEGDMRYTINDTNASDVAYLWSDLFYHIHDNGGNAVTCGYPASTLPMKTIHCGYIDLPSGSSGKYVFPNYEAFLKAASDWGLDMAELDLTDDDFYLSLPVFVQFDLFSTMGHDRSYDGLIIEDDIYYFRPSDDCSDPDDMVPEALDGFVTIAIYPSDNLDPELAGLKTIDGTEWEKYEAS